MKKYLLLLALITSNSLALELKTFTPNTPAVADDVNANFGALVTAIADLEGRLKVLEASAGDTPALNCAANQSISGEYRLILFAQGLGNTGSNYGNVELENIIATATFSGGSSGTLSLSSAILSNGILKFNGSTINRAGYDPTTDEDTNDYVIDKSDPSFPSGGTYTVNSDCKLTLTITQAGEPDFIANFYGTPDKNAFFGINREKEQDDWQGTPTDSSDDWFGYYQELMMLIKKAD